MGNEDLYHLFARQNRRSRSVFSTSITLRPSAVRPRGPLRSPRERPRRWRVWMKT